MEKKTLIEALQQFQIQCPVIKKTEDNPYFDSKYADLKAIWTVVLPVMTENGLVMTQLVEGTNLITTIHHLPSKETLSSTFPIGGVIDNPQKFGSGITYARRYAMTTILGVVTDEDDDGNTASGNKKDIKHDSNKAEEKKPDESGFTIKVTAIKDNQYYRTYTLEKNSNGIEMISLKLGVCPADIKAGHTVTFLGCIKNAKGYWNAEKVFLEA